MDFYNFIADKYRKTLFLATNTHDIYPLMRLGAVKYAVVVNTGHEEKFLANNLQLLHMNEASQASSIADLPNSTEAKKYISSILNKIDYVWTFRPYEWSEDFHLKGKTVLSNSYFQYLSISRKLHQDSMLYKHGNNNLRAHISFKEKYVSRRFFLCTNEVQNSPNELYFLPHSTGCSGVASFLREQDLEKNFMMRSDKIVHKNIPMCQNAVICHDRIIKYQPKVSIIKETGGQLKYCGGDFVGADILMNKRIVKNMSQLTHDVCLALTSMGFCGVINCDYIYSTEDDKLIFIEVNPRYSACTFILDTYFSHEKRAFEERDLMPSLLHAAAFINERRLPNLQHLDCYSKPDAYVSFNFNKSDWTGFTNGNENTSGTKKFSGKIINSPIFPVTLFS